jgi:two-component system, NarL family, response regulator NreC
VPVRVIIADDHKVVRDGLKALLELDEHIEVIGEAENGDEAVSMAVQLEPDVILLDMNMPGLRSMQALVRLCEQAPRTRVLISTVHEDEGLAREVLRVGASGYITKRAAGHELAYAVKAIARGKLYVHSALSRILNESIPEDSPGAGPDPTLTNQEVEVLRFLARGYTNLQVAETLQVSLSEAEDYRMGLMSKLGLRSRIDLVNYAEARGLLGLNSDE